MSWGFEGWLQTILPEIYHGTNEWSGAKKNGRSPLSGAEGRGGGVGE